MNRLELAEKLREIAYDVEQGKEWTNETYAVAAAVGAKSFNFDNAALEVLFLVNKEVRMARFTADSCPVLEVRPDDQIAERPSGAQISAEVNRIMEFNRKLREGQS
jgi:hypothetical protein